MGLNVACFTLHVGVKPGLSWLKTKLQWRNIRAKVAPLGYYEDKNRVKRVHNKVVAY